MKVQPQITAHADYIGGYWLASGRYNGRTIVAEGQSRQDALFQWIYATLHHTNEECEKLMRGSE